MTESSTLMPSPKADLRPKDLVRFRRNRFVASFPRAYLYSPAHFWLCADEESTAPDPASPTLWRVGLTHFASRMLGDIVEFDVEKAPGERLRPGEVIGWIEGMKAITDLFCIVEGDFAGVNEKALGNPELVCKDPYGYGWLYAIRGVPDAGMLDVEAYLEQLGEKIDAMEEQPWKT